MPKGVSATRRQRPGRVLRLLELQRQLLITSPTGAGHHEARPGHFAWGGRSGSMNLEFAVERLYETGWSGMGEWDADHLPDGRAFPSVLAAQRDFARAGLELSIKQN